MEVLDAGRIFNYKTQKHVSWMYSAFGFLAFIALASVLGSGSFLAVIPPLLIAGFVFSISKGVIIYPEAKY